MAGAISYQARFKSIDYVYKRYARDTNYSTNDGSRLDLRIAAAIKLHDQMLSTLLFQITALEGKTIGNVVCEWTLMRVPHSINQLHSLAQRGNLYECCAVGRMILEQIAWAVTIDRLDNTSAIHKVRAESCIGVLKSIVPSTGRLYGWLSSHTHWRYDGHIKAMAFEATGLSTTLQSARFKAIALSTALVLLSIATLALRTLRKQEVLSLLASQNAIVIGGKITGRSEGYLDELLEPRTWSTAEIRRAIKLNRIFVLARQIQKIVDADKDIALLSQVANELENLSSKLDR